MLRNFVRSFSKTADLESITFKGKDTHEYLKASFGVAKNWYAYYGTMPTNKLYEQYLPFIELDQAKSVLQTGSGPGNGVNVLLKHMPTSCKLTATDQSPDFLETLRAIKAPNLEVVDANFEQLDFPAESFDRYVSNMAVHNAVESSKPFTQAFKVLKKGGFLAVSVFGSDFSKNTYMKVNKIFREFAGQPYHDSILYNLTSMGDPDTMRKLILSAGFSQALSYGLHTVYPYKTPEEAMDLYYTFPSFQMFMEKNPEKRNEFRDLIYRELKKCIVDEGTPIGYEAIIGIGIK